MARSQLAEQIAVFGQDGDGEIGGWAGRAAHGPDRPLLQVDPSRSELLDEIITWASADTPSAGPSFEVYDGDETLAQALALRGFSADPTAALTGMFRPAGGPSPQPDGYRIRPVALGEETERVEVHRRAWRPADLPFADGRAFDPTAESPFGVAKYRAVRETWLYRPDLDLVVEARDGSLAASCIAWLDPASGCAEIEPMGVVPEHRRRGLAVDLCLEVAHRVGALGGREVFVNVAPRPEYPASFSAYVKAGFVSRRRGVLFRRGR